MKYKDPTLERLAWIMDRWFRIGPFSIGLDGLLGLIPGFGDVAGGVLSVFIIAKAMQHGVPRIVILRMVMNVGIDSLGGSIPLVGDFFDFAFRANVRNLDLYRQALAGRRRPIRDWGFVLFVMALLVAVIAIPIVVFFFLVRLAAPYMSSF